MLKKVLRGYIRPVRPEYSTIKPELDELILIPQFLERRERKKRIQVDFLTLPVIEIAQ